VWFRLDMCASICRHERRSMEENAERVYMCGLGWICVRCVWFRLDMCASICRQMCGIDMWV
jgi:hypothetical protein